MSTNHRVASALVAMSVLVLTSRSAHAGNILVIGDGDADATVVGILANAGHDVTLSPAIEYQYDGTNPSPAGFCAVVHLNGDTYATGMPVAGQQTLQDYVINQGGGFIGMEWNAYEESPEGNFTMANMPELILMVRNSGFGVGARTYTLTAEGMTHPATAGLPASFSVNAGGNIGTCKTAIGMQVLATESNGDAICAREVGAGRVVNYSHSGNWSSGVPFTDPTVAQMLLQSVSWMCRCGDGVIDPGEQCDDGNANNSDDCLDSCMAAACGDGIVHDQGTGTEVCDDGNAVDNDDCTNACALPVCGDGVVHDQGTGTEVCDDGNAVDNDDCTNACALPACGDGIVHDQGTGTEACDDGNASNTDDCLDDCTAAACGDGFLNSDGANVEECDEGTSNSDVLPDACRSTCESAHCGDGVRDTGEPCDDGAGNSDTEPDACRTSCAAPTCGDGVVDLVEECDDGAGNSDTAADACRTSCLAPVCGDGIIDSDEQCDDGADNGAGGGMCSATCTLPKSGCDCQVGHAAAHYPLGQKGGYGLLLGLLFLGALEVRRRRASA